MAESEKQTETVECDASDDETALYEATVVTGLEKIAAEECEQKLNCTVNTKQGRIVFESNRTVNDILTLRGVDNVYVVVRNETLQTLPVDKEECKTLFEQFLEKCEWRKPLRIWSNVFDFNYELDSILEKSTQSTENVKKPVFRVTCNRTGDNHCFTSNEAAAILGGIINETYHWPVSMKQFDLEIIFNIKDKELSVGIALTRQSLHYRNLVSFGPTSLKATICHNMLRLAEIQTGDIVCDPMCGSGAILVESSISWSNCFNIASDIHPKAIENTLENTKRSAVSEVDIMSFDATKMPFSKESIDVFITDLPFGKRIGSKRDNRTLYPLVLKEMARCAKLNTGRVVLLTQDKKNLQMAIENHSIKQYWKRNKYVYVKVGGLDAGLFRLIRTINKFV
ncbi:THUMP domain-containing protein 3-like isoform X2 [Dinothrombium tinctorium]|uniref:THUMP domain-containing protein 3-like isoform X2 n=1 Tax=Dinothrombium tinctorium TaxID=1965070 RepID=A0A443RAF0_9ACAR|nr:THUMP domain-containing protein 3-like isoform X2 [Dinothrombium tinctorium]